jgi:deazaflavin-dependent oxidoreductase (nitroreductase family)
MALADEPYGYVTTIGRVSGEPREIEIWFALDEGTVYLLSGGGDRSNWVRNLLRDPRARVRIGEHSFAGRGRLVEDPAEDARARELVGSKYGYSEESRWRRTALAVAIDLEPA